MEEALIGLVAALLGIVITNLFARLYELRKRNERETELVVAIHAEITAGLGTASTQTQKGEEEKLLQNEIPFGPADRTDHVFDSIKSDLTSLPLGVIHEVVGYYKLAAQSNLYTDDLKHPLYLAQSLGERRTYRLNLIDLLETQNRAAERAIRALEKEAVGRGVDLAPKRQQELHVFLSDEGADRT